MRNYIHFLGKDCNVTIQTSPVDTNYFAFSAFGRTPEEYIAQRDGWHSTLIAGWPGGIILADDSYDPPADVYFLMDRGNLMDFLMMPGNGNNPSFVVGDTWFINNKAFVSLNPDQSPRYTGWKDDSGTERKPTPSDLKRQKGSVGLDIRTLLAMAYSTYRNEHRYVVAQRFLQVLILLNDGTITETEAGARYDDLLRRYPP